MMRHSLAAALFPCALWVLTLWTVPALARPLDEAGALSVFQYLDLRSRGSELLNPGVFAVAQAGTTWFGGTVWAADSMRWEAIEGQLWTFESGVGSSIVPTGGAAELSSPTRDWVDPAKIPGLHASMEGWIGLDHTSRSHSFFRRLAASDPRWDAVCVGAAGGLSGEYSYWAGVFPDEADSLCFIRGQGYGNEWRICLEHPFQYTGGSMSLSFRYRVDIEPRFDYVFVYMDTTGNDDDAEFMSFTGTREGQVYRALTPGEELPATAPRTITLKFCLETDGAWSDADGMHPTTHGAFAIDDILVAGGGVYSLATFETGDDGWVLTPPEQGPGGEWANLVALSALPAPLTPCTCALQDTVLVFHDDSNHHPRLQNNVAVSPWIDLGAAGLVGSPGKVLRMNLYAELPLKNYVFARAGAQWYPAWCPSTGQVTRSPWTDATFVYYFGGTPQCTSPDALGGTQVDLSAVVPPAAEQVRLSLGVISYCRFFADCTGMSNTTPWFDEVGLGVYGTPGPPPIFASDIDRPQDNFPENGTVNLNAPGRVDCNNIQGAARPEIGTTLGDTLIVRGGLGNAEVYVHFRVVPGPGTNGNAFNAWRSKHADSPLLAGFKRARCDTAERGLSGPILGAWMTAYHEADPNFTGTDRDIDPLDVAPNGGSWRLRNDIFPDNLFTMGTRIDVFYTASEAGQGTYWRDPPGTGAYEMEVLPSSATSGGSWNCTLYVDHYNRDAQAPIEAALRTILGTGSENFESTNWDRFDVNAEASGQASFGRPLQTEYGMGVLQAMSGYKVILWNTGELSALALTKEDGDVLIPWLTSARLRLQQPLPNRGWGRLQRDQRSSLRTERTEGRRRSLGSDPSDAVCFGGFPGRRLSLSRLPPGSHRVRALGTRYRSGGGRIGHRSRPGSCGNPETAAPSFDPSTCSRRARRISGCLWETNSMSPPSSPRTTRRSFATPGAPFSITRGSSTARPCTGEGISGRPALLERMWR